LWTVGSGGSAPFGSAVRERNPPELVYLLGEVGAHGVNFHANDLIPIDATPAEAEAIKKDFRKAPSDTGLVVLAVYTDAHIKKNRRPGWAF
jgi:xylose isomerase